VTAHISTDVAAVPLLWVIPLALYLLTFVIVFARRPIIPHWLVVDAAGLHHRARRDHVYEPIKMIVGSSRSYRHRSSCWRWSAMASSPATAGAAASDRILYVDVGRRHDRRDRLRPDRALHVQLDRRVSDPDRACGAVPPGLALPKSYGEQIIFFGALAVAVLALVLFRAFEVEVDTNV
jgi:hypothetical protein